MSGSKKGERRGNARKRAAKPPGSHRDKTRTHETPNEIMREALRQPGTRHLEHAVIERRIQVARIILGYSGAVEDVTPKEALLQGMQHNLQAIRDWTDMVEFWSSKPVTRQTTENVEIGEREIERLWDKVGEFAFKVAGYIHPKLQAIAVQADTGASQASVLQELMDEIDQRERAKPIPIEHKTNKMGG
jgi:hypothetical protein